MACKVLLVAPRFTGQSFWGFRVACEVYGARYPAPPLGLITVAALLPPDWDCRLVDRNTETLREADLRLGGSGHDRRDAAATSRYASHH